MDIGQHYQRLYETLTPTFGFTAQTPQALADWQQRFRSHLRGLLGVSGIEAELRGYEPRAQRLQSVSVDGYTREYWHLWTEPTLCLPFYLLKPGAHAARTPLVLTPHGHNHPPMYVGICESETERRQMLEGDRDIAVQAVKEGYTVIAPTTRGFGETRSGDDRKKDALSSCRLQLMHGLLVGRTPIGERVWDMSRLIDWALAHLDIDAERIAITGNSGGGTVSLFAGACEERIAVVVPGCYFCTFRGSIGSIHHCDCNYVPGLLRAGEMHDVAGLIAPRPFCAIAGLKDPIFPIAQTRLAFARLQQVYRVAGVPERCRLYVGDGEHRYYKAGAWPFMREFL